MKKIVIVGASSGIGFQVAADFARAGWRVGMAARRLEPMQAIKDQYPDHVEIASIDVTAPDAPQRFADLIEAIDGMDTLLFCSGTGFTDPELDDARIVNTLEVNVVGFARIVAEAYKYFRATASVEQGQIAVITSVAATKGLGIAASYSASKRFQVQFINSLEQLAYTQQVNVAFTDIRPGFVRTPILRDDRSYPMIMSVAEAAKLVERAVVARKRVAVIDSRWRIVAGLWSLIPQRLWRHVNVNFN
ncbi:MAG: SDR family NAD(P)-dependent oxidoreductase [Muribaculaceae bacterium]|jgi:short-subunit dehydrogenase|nr:SDR family NAD(P)-dependent oxidoreductase [Muribaculaceae bacterium]